MLSPLEQFRYPIVYGFSNYMFDINLSIINLFILEIVTLLFLYVCLNNLGLISNKISLLLLEFNNVAAKFMEDFLSAVKQREKNIYPAIVTLFLFLVMLNLSGIVPYTTTITTHFFVTVGLAITFSLGMLYTKLNIHGLNVFVFFLPHGIPTAISPFLVVIEMVLYIFRPLSLSIRLFANMMAGHALLKIISGGIYLAVFKTVHFFMPVKILYFFTLIGILNFIILLEVLVCVIQAYVFTLLICIYIRDVYVSSH